MQAYENLLKVFRLLPRLANPILDVLLLYFVPVTRTKFG